MKRVGGLLLVAVLFATACGARLDSSTLQAAKARAGGGGSGGGGTAAVGPGSSSSATVSGGATATTVAGQPSSSGGGGTPGVSSGGTASAPGGPAASAPAGLNPFGGVPAGGNGGSTDIGVTATEIDVGNVSTEGGPVPGLFQGALDGALAYAAYVNSKGGIYGRRLVVKGQDDQLNAAQNKAATDALLGHVLGFLGSFSLESNAGSPDIQAAGAPNVSYAIDQETQHQSTNFSPTPLGAGWPLGPLTYFKNKFGPSVTSKMAVFVEDNPTAIAASQQEQAALAHLGYQTAYGPRKVEATETNFQGDVQNMRNAGVKGLILQGEVSTMARIASAMHDANFKIPFADWGAPAYDPGFISLSNGGAEGAVLNQQLALYAGEDASGIPEVALFDSWMKRIDPGQTIDFYAAQSWAAGALLTQALIQAGPKVTRKTLLAALGTIHHFDDNGMLAPDDPAGKVPPTCWLAIDVTGGKFVRDPADPPTGFRCNDGGYFG